jgi:hypothetical protein
MRLSIACDAACWRGPRRAYFARWGALAAAFFVTFDDFVDVLPGLAFAPAFGFLIDAFVRRWIRRL